MSSRRTTLVSLLFAFALAACNRSPNVIPEIDMGPPQTSIAVGLRVVEVAVYQSLKVPLLAADGTEPAREIDLVRKRPAMVRIFVKADSGFEARSIRADLTLHGSGGDLNLSKELSVKEDHASTDASLASSFNFDLPGDNVTGDATFKVTLREIDPSVQKTGSTDGAVWPADGLERPLSAVDVGASLKVKLIPIRYNADGSGRVPDISEEQLARYRDKMMAVYPVPTVEIEVREPYDWNSTISPNGSGWSTLLQRISDLRRQEGADDDVYYYAAFDPRTSFNTFCQQGCVTGLSSLAQSPNDSWARASIGVGFTGNDDVAAETFVHEVGHAHGRNHAPCGFGVQGVDRNYPHSGALIGAWGYDLTSKVLRSPTQYKDMMSYCNPTWISDYNHAALLERVREVNNVARVVAGPTTRYRLINLDGEGRAVRGHVVEMSLPPGGERRLVEQKGGEPLPGWFYPFSHVAGGFLLVAEPAAPTTLRFTNDLPL